MGELIRLVGPTRVRSEAGLSVFQSLVRAIAYQMISTKAAAAIHGRLLDQCEDDIQPERLLKLSLKKLSDKELVKCLTQVRGVGVWSVEMLMIFNLRRADVFPATDLGVRRGHMLAYQLEEMLAAKDLLANSNIWHPYRSVAAWYLWRANDCVDWTEVDTKKKSGKQSAKKRAT